MNDNQYEARVSLIRWTAITIIVIGFMVALAVNSWITKDKPTIEQKTAEASFTESCIAKGGQPSINYNGGWDAKTEYICNGTANE